MAIDRDEIRSTVTQRYGAKAERALAGADMIALEAVSAETCCGPECCVPGDLTEEERSLIRGLYAREQVAGLPDGAIEAAAGCGNPTAIAEIRPGETVLDLGSGGGIDCFLAAKQVGPAGRVIGLDITPKMVDLARRNAADLGVTNVAFELGEIEALPVADASVDVVISNCVVNLSTDKDATLREAFRVLRPGGRLRISDMVWREARPAGADSLEEWAGCIAGAVPIAGFLESLGAAGFVNARADAVRDLDGYVGLASALISAEKPA